MKQCKKFFWFLSVLLIGSLFLIGCGSDDDDGKSLRLTLVHVSDTHSHLEATASSVSLNGEKTYLDMGGFARLASKIKAVRSENKNTLVLHAGDAVQGTLYFTKYEGEADFAFLNMMGFDAMAVGNHEFDKGPQYLSNFIEYAEFPLLSANIDAESEPALSGKIQDYVIKEFEGEKVGIIGLTTPETAVISSPGDTVSFEDEKTAAERAVKELKDQGVNKIIALTHLGYERDIELAKAVDGIDVIVGGHSHTLLGNYAELGLTSAGEYPTKVQNPSGQDVYIVHSWEWAKAAGVLNIEFEDGTVKTCQGNAILLAGDSFQQKDSEGNTVAVDEAKKAELLDIIAASPVIEAVQEDPDALALLETYKPGIDEITNEKIGSAGEDLLHIRVPGTHTSGEEMPSGSYIAPLVCEAMLWKANSVGLDVQISLQNAGGVRIDVPAGDITVGTAYTLLPFGNTLYILEVTGSEFKAALENGITRGSGAFPYVAGARYTANITKAEGERVVSIEVKDAEGKWAAIDDSATYRVATNAYIAGGGDGYEVLKNASGYRYDTGFSDAETFMDYVQHAGTLYRPQDTGITYLTASPESIVIKIAETTDVHGQVFPYDFIEDSAENSYGPVYSLAHVSSYLKEQRAAAGQAFVLVDNGDILQGQPTVYYYNFEKDLTQENHIVADVMNYMGYDSCTVGNHDIEAGHAVYDNLVNQFHFPLLSANAVRTSDREPYFAPYTVIHKAGVKIAILGLTTPHIPHWLPKNLWEGMEFEDMVESAEKWVRIIRETENPDVLIGVFHSGFDYTYGGADQTTPKNENAAQLVAVQVSGFDVIFLGHDHQSRNEVVSGTLVLGSDAYAKSVATATLTLTWNEENQAYDRQVAGDIVSMSDYEPDAEFMDRFSAEYAEVATYVSRKVGEFTESVSSRDAMFGDAAFVDLIHQLQLDVAAAELGIDADISFCAPLQEDTEIEAGSVYVRDMFKLYKYENLLYVMELTGQEVKDYLEFNYDNWMNQMASADDHLINFREEPVFNADTGKWTFSTQTRYYNYDSAAGMLYTVDVSKPKGSRVIIHSMADGTPFDSDATYQVAINSYRGNGGGNHLTSGAGIPQEELANRVVRSTDIDLRYYLMKQIEQQGTVTPQAFGNWTVIPEEWAAAGMAKDYEILYGTAPAVADPRHFAVFSDPHYYDTDLGISGAAFESYLAQDRKLLRESEAILKATIDGIKNQGDIDFVIIPGDLTKDGELSSHEEFASYLKTLEEDGIRVYVIPGNHDVNNPHAYAYSGDEVSHTENVSPEKFAEIYAAYGYAESFDRDANSLSYAAEPVPGVWLLAMDSCRYAENESLGKPVIGGRLSEETLSWILEKLSQAKAQNKKVIAMMHHGLLEHFTGQSVANPGAEYVIENWETVSETLAKAGLNLVFTGHYHAHDITSKSWEISGGTVRLTDVETGSLVTYPSPCRMVTLDTDGSISIESSYITDVDYDTSGLTFPDYAKTYLSEGLVGLAYYTLTLPADQGGYGLPAEQADVLAPQISAAYTAHYAGDESPDAETLGTINAYMQSDDPATQLLGQMLYGLWTDLPPADTQVIVLPDGTFSVPELRSFYFERVAAYALLGGNDGAGWARLINIGNL